MEDLNIEDLEMSLDEFFGTTNEEEADHSRHIPKSTADNPQAEAQVCLEFIR
jgi:hypothetical protein